MVGVGSKSVTSPAEAADAIRAAIKVDDSGKNGGVALRVMRDGHTGFVAVSPATSGTVDDGDNTQG